MLLNCSSNGALKKQGISTKLFCETIQKMQMPNINPGVLYSVQLLEPIKALPYFEAALNNNPTKLQFWFSYIDALIKANMPEMAEQNFGTCKQLWSQSTCKLNLFSAISV